MLEVSDGVLPYKGGNVQIHYLVLDSKISGIFNLGGDLSLFRDCITKKDRKGLYAYARTCIDTIHGFIVGCRLPLTTIALVRGDALGGGFECALSCQVMIAENGVEMGFPEILFNIFPGMGGYHLMSQRLPHKQVERMMLSGRKYSSTELFEMGVIDILTEKNSGHEAVYTYIKDSMKYHNGYMAMKNVRERVHSITHDDLISVCEYWVDVAMNMTDRDIRLMERLIRAQDKLATQDLQREYNKHIA
jgi:DSF synthase